MPAATAERASSADYCCRWLELGGGARAGGAVLARVATRGCAAANAGVSGIGGTAGAAGPAYNMPDGGAAIRRHVPRILMLRRVGLPPAQLSDGSQRTRMNGPTHCSSCNVRHRTSERTAINRRSLFAAAPVSSRHRSSSAGRTIRLLDAVGSCNDHARLCVAARSRTLLPLQQCV